MVYILIILSIIAAIAAVLAFNHFSNKDRDTRNKQRKAKQYSVRADETWDTTERASEFIQSPEMVDALISYYCNLLQRREALHPMEDTQELLAAAEEFKQKCKSRTVKNELTSDQELNTAKSAFSKASKILRASVNKKIITGPVYMSLRNALRMRILKLEVETHERMGDAAGERNDPAIATNHYKYAKKLLIESDLKFEGKNDWVRNITNKNQVLFGNAVADQLSSSIDNEDPNAVDEHGIPRDLDAIAGKTKRKI